MGDGSNAVVLSPKGLNALLQKVIAEYTPQGDFEQFRQFANGFFQSEGSISARIKGNTIIPTVSVCQNLR